MRLPRRGAEVHRRGRDVSLVRRDQRCPRRVREWLGRRRRRRLEIDELLERVRPRGRAAPRLQVLTQRDREVVRRLVALLQALGQGPLEDGAQRVELRPLGQEAVVHLFVGDLVEDRHQVVGVERPPAREQLVEHAADAEEVAPPVDLRSLHLLRGHVVGGAHDVAGARHGGGGQARHAEVHDLHRAVLVDEDVGGLDVAVHDAGLVRVGQPGQDLHDDRHLPVVGHRRRRSHRLLEVLPLEQLHGDVGRAVGVGAEVEDRDHVGVGHLRHGLGFPREALDQLGVVGNLRHHDLEGHVALEDGVVGEVHHSHRALADRPDDLVLADASGQLLDEGGGLRLRLIGHLRGDRRGKLMAGEERLETTPRGVKERGGE